jgi:hypothetical protein
MDVTNNELIDMILKSTQLKRYQRSLVETTYPLHPQQLIFYFLPPSVAFAQDLKLF